MAATATGNDAQPGLRETDYSVGGENAEVSCESEFEAATEGDRGDGADRGYGKGGEGVESFTEAGEEIGGSVSASQSNE